MKISVVTPLYRSSPYLVELHRRTTAALRETGADAWEIIFVNDDSPDDSLAVAKSIAASDQSVTVIDLAHNAGQHRATMAGLAASTGDLVFIMDSDLEDKPEWITLFHREMTSNICDVVYGVMENSKGGLIYTAARNIFYRTLNGFSNVNFPPNVCSARLMTRRYVNALLQFNERELFMAGIWQIVGFTQLPTRVEKVDTSPTTYTLAKLIYVFVNAVTAFSTRPLNMIALFGVGLSFIAFIFVVSIVWQRLTTSIAVEGWASVMAAVLAIGGLSLLFNGIMAIYIGKIFIEVKQRPRVIIREVIGAKFATLPQPPHDQEFAASDNHPVPGHSRATPAARPKHGRPSRTRD